MTIEFHWNGKRYECQRPDGQPPPFTRMIARRDVGPSVWLDLEHVAHDQQRGIELYQVVRESKQAKTEG